MRVENEDEECEGGECEDGECEERKRLKTGRD